MAEVPMVDWYCCKCGCLNSMPAKYQEFLMENHNTFWCINGHGNMYAKKTSIQEVEEKLMNAYATNAQLEERIKKLETSFINRIFPK